MSWHGPLSFALFSFLPSISPFVFLSYPYGRFHSLPSPCPATNSLLKWPLSHTQNPRLLAQASHIPWAMSYLRFDYGRPPSRMNVLFGLLSALCPDVVQIIRGKPVLPTRVLTTSRKKAVGASSQRWCQRRRGEGWAPACTEEHFQRLTHPKMHLKQHDGYCKYRKTNRCAARELRAEGSASKCAQPSTEQSNKVCTNDWTEPPGGTTQHYPCYRGE